MLVMLHNGSQNLVTDLHLLGLGSPARVSMLPFFVTSANHISLENLVTESSGDRSASARGWLAGSGVNPN